MHDMYHKVKEMVKSTAATLGVSGVTVDQVQELAKGVAIAAADAGLVYLGDNVSKVDFGTWTPLVVTVTTVIVREARNFLHGGKLVSDVKMEAIQPVQPEPKAEEPAPAEGEAEPKVEKKKK